MLTTDSHALNPAASNTSMSLFVNTANGVRLNGVSTVSTPNIMASNGVVHIVDAVIGLPTVVTFAVADADRKQDTNNNL
jgi:uncharacterized surface protein with fasciclin (FAS1) repeats